MAEEPNRSRKSIKFDDMQDGANGNWYNNRQLFEKILEINDRMNDFSQDLQDTRSLIKEYNGLREEIQKHEEEVNQYKDQVNNVEDKIDNLQARKQAKDKMADGIRLWGGWVVAIFTLLYTIYSNGGF